ncbi:alkylation response protein AidB-like acyl-CoA dehydrogenase [Mycolicibacterium moriokaense]|uniref:Alkylation response protein AidB-like acyl-CoA dehydrogenase n=2 Tax=Mycolicibacterium moriokaense TaxID=39691 RepID=A0A318HF56_9MYCO|nr:alkylation response protein AidB-like acyl-CoA dehydrogenase [Mycolicibacterium moriokaense]
MRFGFPAGLFGEAMDFSALELATDDQEFLDRTRQFLAANVTEELLYREHETGDGLIEDLHLAMGAEGWLEPEATNAKDGGFTPVQRRIWDLERRRAKVPLVTWGGTLMILKAVRQFGSPELLDEVLPGVYGGEVRFAMGYTEPEGGSDIATCKTRAVRDGDEWVINGQKMFTSGAHNCRYIFLLTNTDPTGRRHRNLTMFLVPTDSPGLEIQGLRTVDGERTNISYYSDVRIPDRYRLGEVNDGWAVLNGPLTAEHGAGGADPVGLADIATMGSFAALMAESADEVATQADIGDGSAAYRLGRAHARIEAALSTPGIFGRVAIAQTMRDVAPELMDVLGSAAALPSNAEHLYRWAPLVGIYGGTIDVFRNMIAQYILGLGRPNYSLPKSASQL